MDEKICGVYAIKNKINNKLYIGSSIDVLRRWGEHKRELKYNKHHSDALQNAYNKYGLNNFDFLILEKCSIKNLREREQYYIDYYDSVTDGYNIRRYVTNQDSIESACEKLKLCNSGEKSYSNIYSESSIKSVIEMLKTGKYRISEISDITGVSYDNIKSVQNHHSWKYLTDGIQFPPPVPPLISDRENVILTEEQIPQIIEMIIDGKTNDEICKIFHVNAKTISDIRNHKTWKNFTNGVDFPRSPRVSITNLSELQNKILNIYKNDKNVSFINIAEEVNCTYSYVYNVIRKYGKYY